MTNGILTKQDFEVLNLIAKERGFECWESLIMDTLLSKTKPLADAVIASRLATEKRIGKDLKVQIFETIKREFKALECADELNTTQGKHELWTPADVALSNAYNEALKKVEKEFTPKKVKRK